MWPRKAPGRLNAARVSVKTHTSERSVLCGTYGHVHRQSAISAHAVGGVSRVTRAQYQLLDLVSMVHCGYSFSLFQVCSLTLGPKQPKTLFFAPLSTHKKEKNRHFFKKSTFFLPMMRGIAKRHGFFRNDAFLVAKSALGPHHIASRVASAYGLEGRQCIWPGGSLVHIPWRVTRACSLAGRQCIWPGGSPVHMA